MAYCLLALAALLLRLLAEKVSVPLLRSSFWVVRSVASVARTFPADWRIRKSDLAGGTFDDQNAPEEH